MAMADFYTLSDAYLMDTTNFVSQGGGTLNSRTDLGGPGVRYNVTLGGTSGWMDMQIGDGFDLPSNNSGLATGFGNMGSDFSAYDTYELYVHNPNSSGPWFMANIYTNDGWTDLSEPDTFTENGWTWVAPGATEKFTIDLTALAYQNHVSNIGVKIGANVTGDESWNSAMGPNVAFDVDLEPVPVPGAVLLGILGLSAAGIKLRKFA